MGPLPLREKAGPALGGGLTEWLPPSAPSKKGRPWRAGKKTPAATRDEGDRCSVIGETLRGCRAKLNLPLNDLAVYMSDVFSRTICGQLKIAMLADQILSRPRGLRGQGGLGAGGGDSPFCRPAVSALR